MSWSLQLRNGDLVVDENKMGAVSGWQKLLQDLRCHLLERLGTDPSYPDFGSTLDGGTTIDGTEIPSPLGEVDHEMVRAFVSTEINRVIREHQQKQIDRVREDRNSYGKTTITSGELLQSADVNIAVQEDVMVVQVVVKSASGDDRQIAIPFRLT